MSRPLTTVGFITVTATGPAESWACILSQSERLEMAIRHDPREPQPASGADTNSKP